MSVSTSLPDLQSAGIFEVSFPGTADQGGLSGTPCAWWSMIWGESDPEDPARFLSSSQAHVTEADLRVQTPSGALSLSWRKLRPHLVPTRVVRLAPGEAPPADLPDAARAALAREAAQARQFMAVEYCIVPGQTYHARVDTETATLPPEEPGGEPRRRVKRVLRVAPMPWTGPEPEQPITPPFDRWTY